MSALGKTPSYHEKTADILIYCDTGVNQLSAFALVEQLQAIVDSSIGIKIVDSQHLVTEAWEKRTKAIIFGGGVCREWDERLGEKGLTKIRNYVSRGGNYIGFCAGAYFACKESYFEQKGQPAIKKTRPLSFFSGKAIGPLFPTEDYRLPNAAQAVTVAFKIKNKMRNGALYCQGGCYFEIERDTARTKIFAKTDSPHRALAIRCKVDKGLAFLCGPHPEFAWEKTSEAMPNPFFANLSRKLAPQEHFRKQVLREITRTMHVPIKKKPPSGATPHK